MDLGIEYSKELQKFIDTDSGMSNEYFCSCSHNLDEKRYKIEYENNGIQCYQGVFHIKVVLSNFLFEQRKSNLYDLNIFYSDTEKKRKCIE